jgi:RHS repeat-associated protein
LGRRTAITTAVSGSAATTFHLWCGARLCQASNANGAPARSYYDEGEVDYASGTQLYYGPDRLGSVRAAANGQSSALQFYDYDPYGNPLQTPAGGPLTDFRYAGMFYHADSGLYLTRYRAYDPAPRAGLSRDPVGFRGGVNLYAYVRGNPLNLKDPLGRDPSLPASGAGDSDPAAAPDGPCPLWTPSPATPTQAFRPGPELGCSTRRPRRGWSASAGSAADLPVRRTSGDNPAAVAEPSGRFN